MIIKTIITACFILTALIDAFSQSSVTPKCPRCQNLEKWQCTRKTEYLTLKNPILNDWIQFDWVKNQVLVQGVKEPYPILNYRADVSEPKETIWFSVLKVTIYYGERGQYVGHKTESLVE